MRIVVGEINQEPIEIKEDISASAWDISSFDVKFVDNININCRFVRIDRVIFADINVATRREIVCSRCLSQVGQSVRQDFKKNYDIGNLDGYLDIDEDIQEEILLNFPMKVLCSSSCRGLCSGCGVNLNYRECICQNRTG